VESLTPPPLDDVESGASLKMHRGTARGCWDAMSLRTDSSVKRRIWPATQDCQNSKGCLVSGSYLFPPERLRFFRPLVSTRAEYCRRVGGWFFRGHALWGIGQNLVIQGRYDAMPWLEESLRIFEGDDARLSMALVWSEMAVCCLGMGQD